MTPLEERLTETLARRAAGVQTRRTPAMVVAVRARRRRRTARRIVVAGAVAAVLGSVAVVALTGPDRAERQAPPPVSTPSTSPSPGPVGALAALPIGPPPAIGYVAGPEYRGPNGSIVPLPDLSPGVRITSVTPFAGGVLVGDDRYVAGTTLTLVADQGDSVRDLGPCTSGQASASTDGTRIAWTSFACAEGSQTAPSELHVLDAVGDEQTQTIDAPGLSAVLGLVGDRVLVNLMDDGLITGLDGDTSSIAGIDGVLSVDPTTGDVAAFLDAQRSCAVLDPLTNEVRFISPTAWPLGAFSPDGSQVLAYRLAGNRIALRVLDARNGAVLHQFRLPGELEPSLIGTFEWDDDDHILVVAQEGEDQAVVRTDLGGRLERATEIVATSTDLVLATR